MCFFKPRKASLTERDDDASTWSLLVLFLIRLTVKKTGALPPPAATARWRAARKTTKQPMFRFGERKVERKTSGDGVTNSECECEGGGGIRRGDALAQTLRRAKKKAHVQACSGCCFDSFLHKEIKAAALSRRRRQSQHSEHQHCGKRIVCVFLCLEDASLSALRL